MDDCPYCDADVTAEIADAHMQSEDQWHFEATCPKCEKKFGVEAEILDYSYDTYEISD